MKYPAMRGNPRNAINVPAFSGGVNLKDALNLVDDNQLTDCKNVWYKDGFLQTRPGVESCRQQHNWASLNFEAKHINNEINVNGQTYHIMVCENEYEDEDGGGYVLNILFFPKDFPKNEENINSELTTPIYIERLFPKKNGFASFPLSYVFYNGQNGGVYMLVTKNDTNKTVVLYQLTGSPPYFDTVKDDDLYAPIVYINGKGDAFEESEAYAPASLLEGHSAFPNAWSRYLFTTDSESQWYTLPDEINDCYIQLKITDTDGKIHESGIFGIQNYQLTNTAPLCENATLDDNKNGYIGDGKTYRFYVNAKINSVQALEVNNNSASAAGWPDAIGITSNNLEIKIKPITPGKSILAGATQSNAFGGVSEGIYGGTRTFLSGFSGENKNMFVWSDLNNPTYFSENNYNHVGSNSQPITTLAKQDDMLCIYKEKELYYTTYVQGAGYTVEDVIAGRVVDLTTLNAQFPVIQISDSVGCDLPRSVRLCGNRLVWADSNGKVYMLRSANQYSTANVSIISDMLGGNLSFEKNASLIDEVSATTYDGFYMLKYKNKIYLLNFDQYYFSALPSYSDTKKASRKMQWFVWELPKATGGLTNELSVFVENDNFPTLLVTNEMGNSYRHYVWQIKLNSGEDKIYCVTWNGTQNIYSKTAFPIESVVQTKMWDFGAMERFKAIEQMYVEFGKSEGDVEIQYLTERGRLDELSVDLTDTAEEHSPEFIKTKRLLPGIKRAIRFGMRLTAKGQIKLGGILIKLKYMGVTR